MKDLKAKICYFVGICDIVAQFHIFFFFLIFYLLFIYYLFLAVLGLRFCARAFSSCSE